MDETTMKVYPTGREAVEATVEFEVDGHYRPATWGYYGGSPAEAPSIEVKRVWYEDEETGDEVELCESAFSRQENARIVDKLYDHLASLAGERGCY